MFALGLSSGQSSSTDSLRAKKYLLGSSVIYSESRHVCDRPLPLSFAYPAPDVCEWVFLTITRVFRLPSLAVRR